MRHRNSLTGLILGVGCLLLLQCRQESAPDARRQDTTATASDSSVLRIAEQLAKNVSKDENWQTVENAKRGFSIRYPAGLLDIHPSEPGFVLEHSIPFQHPDPCDESGDAAILPELTDFKVRMEVLPMSLQETVKARESEYFISSYLQDNELKLDPGFVDKVNFRNLSGYRIFSGAHGCGEFTYYFPLNPQQTLHVRRSIVPELTAINPEHEKYLALPGVIEPKREQILFEQIMNSIEIASSAPSLPEPESQAPTYRVVKVAQDDVLNIRSGVGTQYPIVGSIPPDSGGVLITGEQVKHGRSVWVPVKYRDIEGWVNRGYLEPEPNAETGAAKK